MMSRDVRLSQPFPAISDTETLVDFAQRDPPVVCRSRFGSDDDLRAGISGCSCTWCDNPPSSNPHQHQSNQLLGTHRRGRRDGTTRTPPLPNYPPTSKHVWPHVYLKPANRTTETNKKEKYQYHWANPNFHQQIRTENQGTQTSHAHSLSYW